MLQSQIFTEHMKVFTVGNVTRTYDKQFFKILVRLVCSG